MRPGECKGGDVDGKDIKFFGVKWHVLMQGGRRTIGRFEDTDFFLKE
jgi:hypothetical protein